MNVERVIAILDIGTTNMRGSIYTETGQLTDQLTKRIEIISEVEGQYEIDPEIIFADSVEILRSLLKNSNLTKSRILSLGLSTHRNSFLLWDKESGKPYCNLIGWNDKRSLETANSWNESYTIKTLKYFSRMIHFLTKSRRFSMVKCFKFKTVHTIIRLFWILNNNPTLKNTKSWKNVLFGTLETWIVWKFTNGESHITDLSSVSATAMYDITSNSWNHELLFLFRIPLSILPKVVNTHGETLAIIKEEFFEYEITITSLIADQQAASFGSGCLRNHEAKMTLGTGTFLDITTPNSPIPIVKHNFSPLVGWASINETNYIFEGHRPDTSMKILNFMRIENILDPKVVDQMAYTLYLNENTGSPLLFQKSICERARIVLESISIEFLSLWNKLGKIIDKTDIKFIKANGGVSNSDYVLQCISTICQIEIRRMKNIESTSVGTMLLTRITHGHNIDQWPFDVEKVFLPQAPEHKDIILSRHNKFFKKILV